MLIVQSPRRLTGFTDPAGTVTYTYDANGRLTKTTRPDGSIMTTGYDAAGQMVWQNDVDSAESGISRYEFTLDAIFEALILMISFSTLVVTIIVVAQRKK